MSLKRMYFWDIQGGAPVCGSTNMERSRVPVDETVTESRWFIHVLMKH